MGDLRQIPQRWELVGRIMRSTNPARVAGATIVATDKIMHDGTTAWTQVDAKCTPTTDAGVYRTSVASSKLAFAADAVPAVMADAVTDDVSVALASAGYSAVAYWIRSSVATSAGDLRIAVSAEFGYDPSGVNVWRDVPALAADTWTRCAFVLMPDEIVAVDASGGMSSLMLWLERPLGAQNVWIDDVRLLAHELTGGMGYAASHTIKNDNADDTNVLAIQPPRRAAFVTVSEVPVDVDLFWLDDGVVSGRTALKQGQTAADLIRPCNAVGVLPAALGAGDTVVLEVGY